MNQVTLCIPTDVDGEGFRQRLRGHSIRDCILVLTSGEPSFGLLHKEPSKSTFVEEEIRGTKVALNIDSSRIVYGKPEGSLPSGRFPTNLVLEHDPECEKLGMETIDNWNCVDHCPVCVLEKSTVEKIHGAGHMQEVIRGGKYKATSYTMGFNPVTRYRYGDSGGASRFFKQVTPDDLTLYFNTLIRKCHV